MAGGVSAAGLSSGCSAGERRRTAEKRALAGAKAAHAGSSGHPGLYAHRASGRAAGAFSGPSRGFFRGAPGKNRAAPGQNGAFGRPSGAGTAGVGGKKAPFCREKGGQRGCAGAKTGGESWRGVKGSLAMCRESSGGFGGKSWGFEKAFSRAYRKKPLFAPFLCRWRTVIGADNLVDRSGCYLGRKE